MLDSHCHLDRYRDARSVAEQAADKGVFTIAVTNLPSHFRAGLPHVRKLAKVRLALGLHPLAAAEHCGELADFEAYFATTSFIGEVGLDYSNEGRARRQRQLESFRFVAGLVGVTPKVVSLHSRGAEADVLAVLDQFGVKRAIFHWYSGTLKTLDDVITAGHLLSVNPAMIRSAKGREIIARIPRTQILSETDGPYVQVGGAPAMPWDVALVEKHLAKLWNLAVGQASAQMWSNFVALVDQTRPGLR
ncbi:MAG TPA: TatD family hydrolase [Vicinamibacterales bacterium]|jgi:TatD DNase family protein